MMLRATYVSRRLEQVELSPEFVSELVDEGVAGARHAELPDLEPQKLRRRRAMHAMGVGACINPFGPAGLCVSGCALLLCYSHHWPEY